MIDKIKVSVIMITYNHEKFIEEAVLGVLMQEGNFDLELILANDCSPDNTDEIIKRIINTNRKADKIRYLNHQKNKGIMSNFIDAYSYCSGEYIAFCEGDDYWIDPNKIQKQIDVFMSNEEIGLVHTALKYYNQSEGVFLNDIVQCVDNHNDIVPALLKAKYIDFCTVMIKSNVFAKVIKTLHTELIDGAIIGDTRIILESALNSKVGFVKDITTVYRVLQDSASHPTNIKKYIYTIKDTYNCRKQFIDRNGLNKKYLGFALCNFNKSLITEAYKKKKYSDVIKLVSNLNIIDYYKYCDFETFRKKITLTLMAKFILSTSGFGVIKNKFAK